MKQPVTYGFFGEDAAQRNFLSAYLNQQYLDTFTESETFGLRIKATNKDQVDSRLPGALLVRRDLGLDILFVGRDTDSSDPKSIQLCRERFEKHCVGQHPVMFLIPVQCIEHWLWYIKRHRDSPGVNKPLEPYTRTEAKKVVYGDALTAAKRFEILNALVNNFDIAWLETRSESFKRFHRQVKGFVDKL